MNPENLSKYRSFLSAFMRLSRNWGEQQAGVWGRLLGRYNVKTEQSGRCCFRLVANLCVWVGGWVGGWNRKHALQGSFGHTAPEQRGRLLERAPANYFTLVRSADVNIYPAWISRVDAAWNFVLNQQSDLCSPSTDIRGCPSFTRFHTSRNNVKGFAGPCAESLTTNAKPSAIRRPSHMRLCLHWS